MPAVKPMEKIREKWTRVTPMRGDDYRDGIENPRRDWDDAARAAEPAWTQGVTQAAQEKRYGRGVQKVGSEKWRRKALAVGVSRFGEGVRVAGPDYEAGFAPYRAVIERVTLPPRGPKGDPKNIERVAAIARALYEAKTKGAGGGVR